MPIENLIAALLVNSVIPHELLQLNKATNWIAVFERALACLVKYHHHTAPQEVWSWVSPTEKNFLWATLGFPLPW